MKKSPFHRPLPLDTETSRDWTLASTQAAEEHVAWLRLRGFVSALIEHWPQGKTWMAITPVDTGYALHKNAASFGRRSVNMAQKDWKHRGEPSGTVKEVALHPEVVEWFSMDSAFISQFKQLFEKQYDREPLTSAEMEERSHQCVAHTPATLNDFLLLPLVDWTRSLSRRMEIVEKSLDVHLPPGSPTSRARL